MYCEILRYCKDLSCFVEFYKMSEVLLSWPADFVFFAIVSFRFNFSLRYWFHGTCSWFRNICLTSHHVWVLLESHKPVSSALDHVGATGAMVRGYRGLDHGIMGHGVVGHPGPRQLECTEAQCRSSQVQWQQPTDAPRWHSVLSKDVKHIFGNKMLWRYIYTYIYNYIEMF